MQKKLPLVNASLIAGRPCTREWSLHVQFSPWCVLVWYRNTHDTCAVADGSGVAPTIPKFNDEIRPRKAMASCFLAVWRRRGENPTVLSSWVFFISATIYCLSHVEIWHGDGINRRKQTKTTQKGIREYSLVSNHHCRLCQGKKERLQKLHTLMKVVLFPTTSVGSFEEDRHSFGIGGFLSFIIWDFTRVRVRRTHL